MESFHRIRRRKHHHHDCRKFYLGISDCSVGIRVATVSTMMLVNRVFDLFSDFLMGYQGTAIVYGVAAGVLILIGFF